MLLGLKEVLERGKEGRVTKTHPLAPKRRQLTETVAGKGKKQKMKRPGADDKGQKMTKRKFLTGRGKKRERERMKWGYKRGGGNWDRLKDHEFEWSEEFIHRQQRGVFDRLLSARARKPWKTKKPAESKEAETKKASTKKPKGKEDMVF